MSNYFIAMLMLSAGSFIHSRSSAPEMRPATPAADIAWEWLARAAFIAWIVLIVWGFARLHWSQPLAGLIGSLGVNALLGHVGPLPAWPRISAIFCAGGLLAAVATIAG